MNENTKDILCHEFKLERKVIDYVDDIENAITEKFREIDEIKAYNQFKVIKAMQENRLSSTDFYWTTGYGYGDIGRDKVESVYASVFNTEDALVRPTIASGTHAITLTLSGILRPGDELIAISGAPYDTLQKVIGVKGNVSGSLIEYGTIYKEIPLINNKIDLESVKKTISEKTKMVMIQRSTGYSDRRALTIDEIEEAIQSIREYNTEVIIMVDNCYGEFLELREPTDVGADIIAGSLIKNPGGGLALSGGYIVGKQNLVEQVANRLTAPGLGKECGLTFGTSRTTMQGLFLAPHIVAEAVKGALLVAKTYKELGFKIVPEIDDNRSDIIQGVELLMPERVSEFCKGIQAASTVDSYVIPEAWDMPGYEDKVIMAAGGFIEGSSIELSADGPMREPYYVYYQGGLTYEHCKLGVLMSLNNLYKKSLVDL
ncbi:aminotransferase class I/II-fold pyridoxal phosphate-dependent enzyme [Tissierella sp. Yu-01]|uniref:methionine gamma-lyase family protein n=1 Tax=Tissierella sp. Yu-01 TaxID=3035694 RepID=UPI00240D820B|nr:aminotransferase class I/II-fold pyridoxal phosphate-dependent enzyme [Tissierella sp. Yu-01]WFA09733.1 aminotransferase class I/II-fold pyridoxal phosphate-dependent enzyme [Tissierella sp. Yu-01]